MTKVLERVHFSSAQIIIAGFATVILLGAAAADASLCEPRARQRQLCRRAVHRYLRRVRHRSGGARYRIVLVGVRTGGHFDTDSNRRHGRGYGGGSHCHDFGQKDQPDAAQHHAGSHFGASCGRRGAADGLYRAGQPADRAGGRHAAGDRVRSGVWRGAGRVVLGVPFHFRVLQCGV